MRSGSALDLAAGVALRRRRGSLPILKSELLDWLKSQPIVADLDDDEGAGASHQ